MFEKVIEEVAKHLTFWTILGFTGQLVFGGRFVIQWLASEKRKKSHVPVSFWYMSLIGSLILLAYSLHQADIVFIAGFSLNGLIYLRNLHLIYKAKAAVEPASMCEDATKN